MLRIALIGILAATAILIALSLPGCKTITAEEADARAAEAEQVIAGLEAERDAIEADAAARLAELQNELDELRNDANASVADIERIETAINAVDQAVAKTVGVLTEAQTRAETALAEFQAQRNEDGSIGPEGQARSLLTFVPEPFRTYGLLGLNVFFLIRSSINRNAGRSLASSIEAARDLIPQFGQVFDDPKVKRALRAKQSATAQRMVREAKKEATPLPA